MAVDGDRAVALRFPAEMAAAGDGKNGGPTTQTPRLRPYRWPGGSNQDRLLCFHQRAPDTRETPLTGFDLELPISASRCRGLISPRFCVFDISARRTVPLSALTMRALHNNTGH
jgi:hypothetical protein